MIILFSKKISFLNSPQEQEPFIGSITNNSQLPDIAKSQKIFLCKDEKIDNLPAGYKYILYTKDSQLSDCALLNETCFIKIPGDLDYLDEYDIIKINPVDSSIRVLYRYKANANSFLVTERCNSFCLMCSQPPRDIEDSYIINEILQTIPLIHKETKEIGLTGGEPTLIGEGLFDIIRQAKNHLPNTSMHILTNGRNFKDINLAMRLAKEKHHDLMLGIPLYSDISEMHDFVVQADGAYDETIRGILNLKRCNQKVEIRVVIHQQTYKRLPELANFIVKNLLFVDHVALMGLEMMGFTKTNLSELWVDPHDYHSELEEATKILARNRIRVSIYNHQLCLVPESVRKYNVKSISDWKNEYMPECSGCNKMNECGGFFSSAPLRYSDYIKPALY